MTKKKVILLVVAALFAVSGLTALPSYSLKKGRPKYLDGLTCGQYGSCASRNNSAHCCLVLA